MAEQRTDDEVMNGRDIQPSPDPNADPSSGGMGTADVAGVRSAEQATSTDVSGTETTPPDEGLEPQVLAAAPTADQPAKPVLANEERRTPLFAADAAESFRSRWRDIQTSFVDEPKRAVVEADGLVAEVMGQLAKTFADERSQLESHADSGTDVSTEDLFLPLRYLPLGWAATWVAHRVLRRHTRGREYWPEEWSFTANPPESRPAPPQRDP